MGVFIQYLFTNPTYFFMIALIVVFSVCLHEYFHAQVAYWEGDFTLAERGYLTLNPLVQMGPISILVFCLVGFAWGGVPVNTSLIRSPRWGMLRVSLAGPLANFLLFLLAWTAMVFIPAVTTNEHLHDFIRYFGIYNVALLLLNSMPLPGFDGWGIVSSLFPALNRIGSEFAKGAMVFAILLVIAFAGIFFMIGNFAMITAEVVHKIISGTVGA